MPAPHIGRVALSVADLERSVRYYTESIGLAVLAREGGEARLAAGDRMLLLLREQPGARPVARATGLYHFALLLPTRRDLGRTLRHLLDTRVSIGGYADHAVSEAIYLTDPDGHGIEIYRDRPRSEWAYPDGRLKMTVDPFDFGGVLAEVRDEAGEWTGLPAGTMIGHIHLQVTSIAATEQFYTGPLGFDLIVRYGAGATFLAANGYHHHLGANTWAGVGLPPAPADAARLLWYEIVLPDADAVAAIAGQLAETGYPFEREDERLWVTDPSGIRILLNGD